MPELWKEDLVQFARLLCELTAAGAPDEETMGVLQESMDLSREEIGELFERADVCWEKFKRTLCPPARPTPKEGKKLFVFLHTQTEEWKMRIAVLAKSLEEAEAINDELQIDEARNWHYDSNPDVAYTEDLGGNCTGYGVRLEAEEG